VCLSSDAFLPPIGFILFDSGTTTTKQQDEEQEVQKQEQDEKE